MLSAKALAAAVLSKSRPSENNEEQAELSDADPTELQPDDTELDEAERTRALIKSIIEKLS